MCAHTDYTCGEFGGCRSTLWSQFSPTHKLMKESNLLSGLCGRCSICWAILPPYNRFIITFKTFVFLQFSTRHEKMLESLWSSDSFKRHVCWLSIKCMCRVVLQSHCALLWGLSFLSLHSKVITAFVCLFVWCWPEPKYAFPKNFGLPSLWGSLFPLVMWFLSAVPLTSMLNWNGIDFSSFFLLHSCQDL